MSESNSSLLDLLDKFKGVEGFLFMNKAGELGYFRRDDSKPVKESFPQLKDDGFLKRYPGFPERLQAFGEELKDIPATYLGTVNHQMEIGYLLPADNRNPWKCASVILHEQVINTIQSDYDRLVEQRKKELIQAEREMQRFLSAGSIYQIMDGLIDHVDAYGAHRFFPVLFYKSGPTNAEFESNLRIINLRWRTKQNVEEGAAAGALVDRDDVFTALKENLLRRGAIDRDQRLENKFSLS